MFPRNGRKDAKMGCRDLRRMICGRVRRHKDCGSPTVFASRRRNKKGAMPRLRGTAPFEIKSGVTQLAQGCVIALRLGRGTLSWSRLQRTDPGGGETRILPAVAQTADSHGVSRPLPYGTSDVVPWWDGQKRLRCSISASSLTSLVEVP